MDLMDIKWDKKEFESLVSTYGLAPEWEPEFPASGSIAGLPPYGKMTLYADYFTMGNFRLPITKFLMEVIKALGVHLSQIHPRGIMRIRHFEFVCRANGVEPRVDKFAVFYKVSRRDGLFTCHASSRKPFGKETTLVSSGWEHKFFWISDKVIPELMVRRLATEPVIGLTAASTKNQDWVRKLTVPLTQMKVLPEEALVWAGMSRLWPPCGLEPVFIGVDERK